MAEHNAMQPVVLIAIETLGGGGAERVALDLVKHWPREHAQPILLVASLHGEYARNLPPDLTVLEVGVSSSPRKVFSFLRRLRTLLAGYNLVGVISHMTGMNRMLLRAGVFGIIKAPIVVVEHNDFLRNYNVPALGGLKWFFLRQEISMLYRRAHAVVGCSRGVASQLLGLFSLNIERVVAIVNPLSRCFLQPSPPNEMLEAWLASLEKPLFVSVGRLVPQKCFEELILAFAQQLFGTLVILGEGPQRSALENLAKDLGVDQRVFLPGFSHAPVQVLRAADLYVSSSRWEGYPLTLLEAYASGLPVVARHCNFGPVEIVKPGRPGALVHSMRVSSLAVAMSDAVRSEKRFPPGSVVDLSENDPSFVAERYKRLLEGQREAFTSPEKALRILMLIPELGYGGAESAFLRLANYLADRMDVSIALMVSDNKFSSESAAELPVILLNEGALEHQSLVGKVLRWCRMIMRLRGLKREFDVTISFLSGPNLLNAMAGRPAATIISERGSKRFNTGISTKSRFIWTRLIDRWAYRGAGYVVTASHGLAEEIVNANPRIARKVLAVEGTVQTTRLLELAEAACEPEFRTFLAWPTVVAFGRMHQQKGYDALIRVFARVREQVPSARLLLIGDGPEMANYLALARSVGLRADKEIAPDRQHVVFAGYRANPIRYLKLARVFVMPSRYEGLPNALIEALATGVSVLAADCPWGPRSVLAGTDDEELLKKSELPLSLEYGVLMPMIDTTQGALTWGREIARCLNRMPERRPADECRAAVARFDIEETGKIWLDLIAKASDSNLPPIPH